uniref:kunitz-type serine protease inhibitor kunitoxin-Phi1-like n=1 Tax=Styela clava TaxID=7725 RepID=UPI001939A972|nr:kunitz-type serine protease inhibitor kunitoxin-Phi1-like [Styela clava]
MVLRWILFASVLVALVAQSQGSWFNSFRRSLYRNIDNDNNYNNYGNGQYFGNAAYQREELADCSRCHQPKEEGFCRGFYRRWYYDIKNQRCMPFLYGGCMGNANKFKTRHDCWESCGHCRLKEERTWW